jgi:hypothetical protein
MQEDDDSSRGGRILLVVPSEESMLRSIAAIVGGFVAMAVAVIAGTAAATAAFVPGGLTAMTSGAPAPGPLPPYYLIANIAVSILAAMTGGWVAVRIAGRAPVGHTIALAALVGAMGVATSVTTAEGAQPLWYRVIIPVLGVAGVLIGGMHRPVASSRRPARS